MIDWLGDGNSCRILPKAGSKRLTGIWLPTNAVREMGVSEDPTVDMGSKIWPLRNVMGLLLLSVPVAAAPRMLEKSPVFMSAVGIVALVFRKPRPWIPPEEAMRVP